MHKKPVQFKRLQFLLVLMLLSGLALFPSAALWAASPTDVVQSGANRALELLKKGCRDGQPFVLREHRAEIQKIVNEYCDFGEMAMRALGPAWKSLSAEKQKEFVRLFAELIFNTYIDRVDTYTCADEKVLYDGESLEGNNAVVKSRVTGYKGKDVAIEYRLRLKDGEWKAYDVVVEGISLVNNYRQQFNSILARESFDNLLKRMQEKVLVKKQ
jgi:phospholipid transport system substrate-binding protein